MIFSSFSYALFLNNFGKLILDARCYIVNKMDDKGALFGDKDKILEINFERTASQISRFKNYLSELKNSIIILISSML